MVKKSFFLEEMQKKEKLERTCEDNSIRIEKENSRSTYKTLNKKLKQKSTKPKIKCSKFQKNEVLCETKSNISTKLLTITDKDNKTPYLFDINAQNSIISKAIISSYEKDELVPKISDVWGNNMKALGYTTLNVNIGLQQSFPHKFYVIESNNPCAILGSDFLVKSNLTINAKEKTITQSETGVKLKLEPSNPSCKKTIKKEVKKILETFPEIEKESSNREKSKHNHVLNVKLKNEVLPRYKTDLTKNSIISKEKEKNICNKLLKENIPKTINRNNNGLQTSLSSTDEDYAKKIDKLVKTVEVFSNLCKKISKEISFYNNQLLSCQIKAEDIKKEYLYFQQKHNPKDFTHSVT